VQHKVDVERRHMESNCFEFVADSSPESTFQLDLVPVSKNLYLLLSFLSQSIMLTFFGIIHMNS
jgi:hypothetical protein